MTTNRDRLARRLVRSYPPRWRARHGDEFVELLIDDLRDRHRALPVAVDVLRGATVARFREAGIGDRALAPSDQIDASLPTLVWSLAAGFMVGVAMWSQVVVGWRWEPPNSTAVAVAMVLMSGAAAALCVLAAFAAIPMMWTLLRALRRGGGAALLRPVLLATTGGVTVLLGCRHFAGGWPGTGGHDWSHQELVPAGIASFGWAATRGLSAYWAHPGALASFPVTEVLWMVASPLALIAFVAGVVRIVRGLEFSPRVLTFEIALAVVAVAVTLVFFAGAAVWVLDNGTPGPTGIYRVGMIDVVGLAVMAATGAVACRAALRARDAMRTRVAS